MAITPSILIIDDDPAVRKTLSDILRAKGYAPTTAGQGKTALDMVKEQAPDVILIDLKLEDMSGLEVMAKIRKHSPGTECIVLTGYATQASAIEAVNLGAYGYVQKPCDVQQLLAMIHRAIEKREAEEALQESEHNYRVLFESKIDGMAVIDAETMKVVLANETAAKMYGFDSAEDLIGLNPVKYVHPDDTDRALRTMAEDMFEKDMRQVNEFRTLSKDGREIWVSAVGTRIEYQGRLAGLASFRDITERKRTEGRIQLLTEVLETSPISVIVTDENRKITYVNRVTEELFGYEKGDLLGMDPELLNAEPDADKMQSEIFDAIRQQGIWRGEILNRKKNGDLFYIHASVYWLLDEEGNFIAAAGFQEDITERKRAEEALRESESRYRLLAENVSDVVYLLDSDLRPTYLSPSVTRMLGYSVEETMPRGMKEWLTPASLEVALRSLAEDQAAESLGQKERYRSRLLEMEVRCKDGSTVWTETGVTYLRDPDGQITSYLGVMRDITEEKKVTEALRDSEENFRALAENAVDGILIIADGEVPVYTNKRAAKITGYSVSELRRTSFKDLAHPDELHKIMERYRKRLEGKRVPPLYETVIVRKDGECVPIELGGARTVWHGKPANMVIIRDITERKRAEGALKESEERFRSIYAESPIAIELCDPDGRVISVNQALLDTFGLPNMPEELDYFGIFDDPNLPDDVKEKLRRGESTRYETPFDFEEVKRLKLYETTRSGVAHFDVLITPLGPSEGRPLSSYLLQLQDITERKRAEENAARHHRELTALHHVLMAITQTLDLQEVLDEIAFQAGTALGSEYTSIVTVNEDGSLGLDSETFVDIPPLSIRARPDGVTRSITTSGQPVVVNDADAYGGTNPILISAGIKSYAAAPIKTKDVTTGVLFVHSRQPNAFADRLSLLTDLANQAAIAMENARLYKEASTVGALREADRLKTELLANVSHELRTPLASIKGYCTSMLHFYDRLSDEDKRDSLDEINQASDRLTELIENLLQLSRLEATGLHADKEPTRIEPIISAALEDIQAKAKGHHFVTHVEESLPVLEADPDRIRQVLENLLSNAVKCSPEGTEISVRCEQKGQELVVSVRDQGIGIARKDIDKVFDRFYQVSPGLVQKGSGAGLGLTICKRIVEAHGGRIWAESKPKKGSTFIFTLPLTARGSSKC